MKINTSTQLFIAATALLAVSVLAVINQRNDHKTLTEAAAAPHQSGNDFVVRQVRVFDGEEFSDNRDVWVQAGVIKAIGATLEVPADVAEYDGRHKTLIPGLIDAHTHSFGDARQDALRFGVTTELDMFGDWHVLAAAKRQRESMDKSELADLWSAGTLATAPGGHGTEYGAIPTLSKAEEAGDFVQARVQEGSDYIKIVLDDGHAYGEHVQMKSLGADVSQALINAAHQQHKMAVFHIASRDDAQLAISQGADGLVHLFVDQTADDDFVSTIKKRRAFVVPTLSVIASMAASERNAALIDDRDIDPFLSAAQRASLQKKFPDDWQKPQRLDYALQAVKQLHAAGVVLLAGTDAGNPGTTHGASLHGELEWLTRAGLSNRDALRAATSLPAQVFKLSDRGRLVVGKRADMLLLDGNPDEDIRATRRINMIWKNGYAITRVVPASPDSAPAAVPADKIISDFDQDKISSRYGKGWSTSTDEMMNGTSTATISLQSAGAENSAGALLVRGEIKAGFAYPWAGALFVAAQANQRAVNFAQASELVFWTKGDGRQYNVMAFSANSAGGIPPSQSFVTTSTWQEIRMPLKAFGGLDLSNVAALTFAASVPQGQFEFAIDNVHIE